MRKRSQRSWRSTRDSPSSTRLGRGRPPRRPPPKQHAGSRATLDLKQIRSDPESARSALARRGAAEQLDELLALDERRRELNTRIDAIRADQNKLSSEIEEAARAGNADDPKVKQ